jgi:hypothetical protein
VGGTTFSAGFIPFPITFLLTDLLNEFYGKKVARVVTWVGFSMAVFTLIILTIAVSLPPSPITEAADWTGVRQPDFEKVFGGSRRILVASMVAYLFAQFTDIWVFNRLKAVTHGRLGVAREAAAEPERVQVGGYLRNVEPLRDEACATGETRAFHLRERAAGESQTDQHTPRGPRSRATRRPRAVPPVLLPRFGVAGGRVRTMVDARLSAGAVFLVLLACAPTAAPEADGGTPDAGQGELDAGVSLDGGARRPANAATRLVASCDAGAAALAPVSQCLTLEVDCESLPTAVAEVVVTQPPPGTPKRGVIVFGEGGNGTEFVAIGRASDATFQLRDRLRTLVLGGYVVVDRRWKTGWFGEPGLGLAATSCRYATLLRHVATTYGAGVPLCAVGNSGGSAEVGYALARWDGAELLSLAVMTGGPPMARVDVGCLGDAALAGWRSRCQQEWARTQTECPPGTPPACTLFDRAGAQAPRLVDAALATSTSSTRCTGMDVSGASQFLEESIVSPAARLDYPSTRVRFLVGRQDCTEAPMLGMLYRERIKTPVDTRLVSGMRHPLAQTSPGLDAMVQAVSDCAL